MISYRWRLLVSAIVFVISIMYVLPSVPNLGGIYQYLPEDRINLGLDLKGGMHLTLGVEVDVAVENALSGTGQNLRSLAQEEGITILRAKLNSDKQLEFLLPKASAKQDLINFVNESFPILTLSDGQDEGNGALKFTANFTDAEIERVKNLALDQAVRTIRNRIDQFGVAEPDIRKQADYRIQIQLPGLSDPERAIKLLGQTAHLTFHLVRDDLDFKSALPSEVELFPMDEEKQGQASSLPLNKEPLMTGEDISDARPAYGESATPYVAINFNSKGASTFERVTGENIKKRMAIVLDGKIHSAPTIQDKIAGGRASITGNFTVEEANDLAIILRAGSLPAPVTILEERTVGPSLGKESIESGVKAAIVGALAVIFIMPIYYGFSGLIANGMLVFTMSLLMAGMASFGATLTLPGIAGIVLTIGMAVDASVLTFERIREELKAGLSPKEAIQAGFSRASISITDSNLTTIIAAAILYQFGTGPIKGFAVTLSIGIVASMFTAIFVSRAVFEWWFKNADKKISI